MADRNRRFTVAVAVMPLVLLAMSGLARAATFTVVTPAELSIAITAANSIPGANTINFNASITLSSALPAITSGSTLTINGNGFTLDGASSFQILSVISGATLNLQFLTLKDGSVTGSGGAILNDGTLTVTNSTLSANQATGALGLGFGGAIRNDGTLTVTNSTFSGNQANAGVGAAGGAIYNTGGTVSLKGSILADSTPDNCNTTLTASYSLADDDTCFTNGSSGNMVVTPTSAVGLDPLGLQNNGGPTQTIALESNSPARGLDTDCTDQEAAPQPVFTDQRLFSRPDSPSECDSGAYEFDGVAPIVVNTERLQIARSTNPDSDQVNMAFTFTEIGSPTCDAADDAFNGFTVFLRPGSCGAFVDDVELELLLNPWVVHTVNHQSYGTHFGSNPPATLSARMVQLPTPAAPACGEWTVNIELAGVDTSGLGDGPFALILSNPDGDTGCLDIENAIVGNQINPPTRTVRRGVRR
jgi:hypothetical protein